jgi:hypothetical protein
MKTALPSPSRPLRRALCTALIGIAALWALPRNACAQLYVSNQITAVNPIYGGDSVGEYDAATGAPINADFIRGLFSPAGLAVPVPAPVPEASPWWMMAGCGAAWLGVMLRKSYMTSPRPSTFCRSCLWRCSNWRRRRGSSRSD